MPDFSFKYEFKSHLDSHETSITASIDTCIPFLWYLSTLLEILTSIPGRKITTLLQNFGVSPNTYRLFCRDRG